MLSASIDAVVQTLRLQEPPTLWRTIGYALAVNVISLTLLPIWDGLCKRIIPHTTHLDLSGFSALRATHPSKALARGLPTTTPTQHPKPTRTPGTLKDLAGHWDVYGFIAVDATTEELLFRGVPLVVALWLDYPPLVAVLFGTLLWISLHNIRDVPNTVLSGLLYAWLWLSGAWYLAIAVHVAQNCLMHSLLRVRCWKHNGRYPHRGETDV